MVLCCVRKQIIECGEKKEREGERGSRMRHKIRQSSASRDESRRRRERERERERERGAWNLKLELSSDVYQDDNGTRPKTEGTTEGGRRKGGREVDLACECAQVCPPFSRQHSIKAPP